MAFEAPRDDPDPYEQTLPVSISYLYDGYPLVLNKINTILRTIPDDDGAYNHLLHFVDGRMITIPLTDELKAGGQALDFPVEDMSELDAPALDFMVRVNHPRFEEALNQLL